MKFVGSVLALALAATLCVWLWTEQSTLESVADGVSISQDAGAHQSPVGGTEQVDPAYAAILTSVGAAADLWRSQDPAMLEDPALLADALDEARTAAAAEAESRADEAEAQAAREQAAAEEAAREEQAQPRAVSPPPITPPDYEDTWDDDDDDDD